VITARLAPPFDVLARLGQRALEEGTFRSALSFALSSEWARHARVARPLRLPEGVAVVGVGGPTLGGSYKTPLVLALSRAAAARGVRVAVVAHGYGGAAHAARRVRGTDAASDVGDDALWLARELEGMGVPVVVGPREGALGLAASLAPCVVVDALLQAAPVRLALSVLALDERAPFGAGRCPPAGDLRASRQALLDAADVIAVVRPPRAPGGDGQGAHLASFDGEIFTQDAEREKALPRRPVELVETSLVARDRETGREVPLASVAAARVGLVLAIARPRRVEESLATHGIRPVRVRSFADHAIPRPPAFRGRLARPPVDLWLTTPKCATKLGPRFEGAPLVVLQHELQLPGSLVERLLARPS
jgi:tetraacyldisaccharide 4'-kinase